MRLRAASSGLPLPLLLLLLPIAVLSLCTAGAAAAPSDRSPSVGLCRPLSSEFDFAKRPPAPSSDLAFCKEYRQSTCCDKSSSLSVLRSLSPYFDPASDVANSFTESCRQISSLLMCAPCHPDIGTGARVGVCPSLCDQWFNACSDGLFTESEGLLRPCTDASLICAPLREVVQSGAEMCQRTGLGLGSVSRVVEGVRFSDDVERLVQRGAREQQRLLAATAAAASSGPADAQAQGGEEETVDEDDAVTCFDGSVPSASGARSAHSSADASAAAGRAASGRDSPKKYYKTAEEIAEIDRRRAARADAAQAAELANHPVVQGIRRAGAVLQSALRPLERAWGRMVRKLPLPRAALRLLDSTLGFAAALLAVQLLLLAVWRSLMERCCGGARRRSVGQSRSSSSGWTAELHPDRSAPFSALSATAAGLSVAAVRQQRAERLMQQQYSGKADDATTTNAAAAPSTRQVTIIDGEIVELPE